MTYKIPSRQTGRAYSLTWGGGPAPGCVVTSNQHREDESFYVLEGDYEFLIGSEALRAEAGSLIYVPKGTLHAHMNVGKGVGRMLVSQTPGGLYERFFEEVGNPAGGGERAVGELQPEEKRILRIAAEHGIETLAPNSSCRV